MNSRKEGIYHEYKRIRIQSDRQHDRGTAQRLYPAFRRSCGQLGSAERRDLRSNKRGRGHEAPH